MVQKLSITCELEHISEYYFMSNIYLCKYIPKNIKLVLIMIKISSEKNLLAPVFFSFKVCHEVIFEVYWVTWFFLKFRPINFCKHLNLNFQILSTTSKMRWSPWSADCQHEDFFNFFKMLTKTTNYLKKFHQIELSNLQKWLKITL